MILSKETLPITWSVLFQGLRNKWLTPQEIINLISQESKTLEYTEDFLVDLAVNEDDNEYFLKSLKGKVSQDEDEGLKIWQTLFLSKIQESTKPIKEKLIDIEAEWKRFNCPEEWRDFIYYMPNEKAISTVEVYKIFKNFLDEEIKKINNKVLTLSNVDLKIDGFWVQELNELFTIIANGLNFPRYFSKNLDSFEECITDLSWYNKDTSIRIKVISPEFFLKKTTKLEKSHVIDIFRLAMEKGKEKENPAFKFEMCPKIG